MIAAAARVLTMSRLGWIFKPTPHLRSCALVLGLCCAMAAWHAHAQSNAHQHFGKVHFPLACNAAVQDEFDLALAMLHTFSFPAAAETFKAVAQKDPDCAMAYWGIAATAIGSLYGGRSEERRVGKECRSGRGEWWC